MIVGNVYMEVEAAIIVRPELVEGELSWFDRLTTNGVIDSLELPTLLLATCSLLLATF